MVEVVVDGAVVVAVGLDFSLDMLELQLFNHWVSELTEFGWLDGEVVVDGAVVVVVASVVEVVGGTVVGIVTGVDPISGAVKAITGNGRGIFCVIKA